MKRQNVETSKRQKKAARLGSRREAALHFDVSRKRRAFTMLEIVIVVAILAIFAAMTIPRLLDHEDRVFNLTCDRVGDLLTMFAQRSSLGQTPVGLSFDHDRRWLMVMVYTRDEDALEGEARWRPDPFIQPVKFPPWETARLLEIRGDGRVVDTSVWPLSTKPGQERPSIEVVMQGPNRTVSLILPPYAVGPRQFDWRDPEAELYAPIDLTSIGRSREDW